MSKTAIILLSSVGNLARALQVAKPYHPVIIALDEAARQAAQSRNINYRSDSDFLQLAESELRELADRYSKKWYKVNNVDFSEFDGYSLGELFCIEVSYKALFELERMIVLIQEIAGAYAPETWVLATDQNQTLRNIIHTSCQQPINIRLVLPNLLKRIKQHANYQYLKLWLRQEGLDYHLRNLVFRVSSWQPVEQIRPRNGGKALTLFIVEIPTSSALETLVPVIQKIPSEERLVITSDPRCQKALKKYNIIGVPFQAHSLMLSQPSLPPNIKEDLKKRWNQLRSAIRQQGSQMNFRGIDLWPIRRPYFRKLFFRRIPIALLHHQLASELLKQYRVRAVVTATDSHYAGQLFVRAAKQQGIYSLTVQHGMVNHPQGYLPVRSSQLAVMGEAVQEWLIKHGARPEQIVITGQPRFDILTNTPKVSRQELLTELELQPERPTWLLAPEPQLGLWMRDLLFDTLEDISEVQAIIRVHPNDNPSDYSLGLKHHPRLKQRVRISRQYDVASALNGCDVVILGRSTLGLEALLVGKHMVVIQPADETGWIVPPYLQEYLAEANFLRVRNQNELANAWKQLRNPQNMHLLELLRSKIIRRYTCNEHGNSTERVIQVIRQLE